MQNVQDTEIQKRVINLVNLYRTKVGWESQIAKEAKEDWDFWEQSSVDMMAIGSMAGGVYGEGPHTEEWIKHLMVNEQLLGHFYAEVAGDNADKDVLAELLPDVYDRTIFTEEDESFLKKHFKEMVNYIILTPCDESLVYVHRDDRKDIMTIPDEVLEFINSRIKVPAGSQIYNPYTGYAQFTSLFKGCKFFCDDKNPWMQVAIYANEVDAEIVANDFVPSSYNAVVSYLYESSDDDNIMTTHLCEAYKNLISGGVMVLLCPPRILTDKVHSSFRKMLIEDKAIKEIIQLPQVMGNDSNSYCLLIAEKGRHDKHVTLIDARVASEELNSRHYMLSFNIAKFNAILENDGKDPNTGLRKVVRTLSADLSHMNIVPEIYVVERPSKEENPVPLANLCSFETTLVRDIQYDLPEDTPWITTSDLTSLFTGDLDMSCIRKADCPNNPAFVANSKDYTFDKEGRFSDSPWAQGSKAKGQHVLQYRRCKIVDSTKDVVLYERTPEFGVRIALVRATGKPFAVSRDIMVFCPQNGFEATSLIALLRLPIVYRQLLAFEDYGIRSNYDKILVPTDKRIICDEIRRMKREEFVFNEMRDKVKAMKTDYINEVRMRKHDMGQKVFDLINTEDLMRYYVENRETESDLWPQIEEQLDHFRKTINELSDMLDQLSQEERFGTPELIDLNAYFTGLQHSSNINGFKLSYQLDRDSIHNLQLSRMKDKEVKDISSIKAMPTVFISKNDLQRVVSNILTNAQKHGFLDSNRKDYEVNIRLEFNAEKGMYQIDFRNNGKPLPVGLNKMRYGIKGEKAGQTAGSGLGGNVVKSIVEHYKGDYDVFMDGDWTVVRIYLPIMI